MDKPLYPMKADSSLDGIKLTLGKRGSVEGDGMLLNTSSLMYSGVNVSNTVNASKMELVNTSYSHMNRADSSKIMNKDNNHYSEQTVDKLDFSGITSLDLNQLRSNQDVFNVNASSLMLNASSLMLNAPTLIFNESLGSGFSGGSIVQYISIYLGNVSYKIPLHSNGP